MKKKDEVFLKQLESFARTANEMRIEYAKAKEEPDGPRENSGQRNHELEALLVDLFRCLQHRPKGGLVRLVKGCARIIHAWAQGTHRLVDGKPTWVKPAIPGKDFAGEPWKRIQADLNWWNEFEAEGI